MRSSGTSASGHPRIGFADAGTPTSRAKPFGPIGCELWMKIGGAPPVDLSECEFVALDNRTPKTVEFEGADANKNGTLHRALAELPRGEGAAERDGACEGDGVGFGR